MYDIEHAINVSRLSVEIGKRLGLDAESLMRLYAAGLFHDIGKILVPEGLLEKPSSLSRDEYGIIQWHTTLGHALLSQMPDEIHKAAAQSALCHHERMDGKGYPQGLYGGEIPLFSRIIAVQRIREGTKRRRPKNTEKNMFAGLLYCADCGRKLHFNVLHPSKHISYFNCSNYRGNRGTCTDTHYIRADALEQVMLLEIRRMTAFLQDKEEDFVKLLMSKSLRLAEKESKRRAGQLRAMLARCGELDLLFTKTYEDNAGGKLSDERFMMITKRYDDEQIALKTKIRSIQAEIDAEEQHKHSAASFLRTVKRYTDIQELTPLIVNELVEKIVVHQAQGTGKNRSQQLEIHYNFIGTLDTPEVACLPQSIVVDTRQGVAVEYITRKVG